jgi:macrodomain Ter protein organizer (MatP/YcbG family)
MALSNAEKQRRYRERHLGGDGEKAKIQLVLDVHAKTQLDRVARHKGLTLTALVEELAAQAERRITVKLTGAALKQYMEGEKTS